jgi:hypothetical protein
VYQRAINRFGQYTEERSVLDGLLMRGMQILGAHFGNVQLMDWDAGCLVIVAHRGFQDVFLRFF